MKRRGGVVVAIVGLFIILVVLILVVNRQKDLVIEDVPKLEITSPAFEANGKIPIEYTGNGKDISQSCICLG